MKIALLMSRVRLVLSVFLLSFLFSCGTETISHSIDLSAIDTLNIDSPNLSDKHLIDQKDVFDSIRYIPLETTQLSIFSAINQLEVTPEHFFILDWSTNKIVIFKRDGKFVNTIKCKTVREFAVNRFNQNIVYQELSNDTTYIYNYKGKLLKSFLTPLKRSNTFYLKENYIANYKYFYPEKFPANFPGHKHSNLVFSDASGKTHDQYLPYDTAAISYLEVPNAEKQFYQTGTGVYFIEPYSYDVYEIIDEQVSKRFHLRFPEEHLLPARFARNVKYKNSRLAYIEDNNDKIYLVKNFYSIDSLITFKISTRKWENTFLYDRRTNTKISLFDILSGKDNNYMPLSDEVLASDLKSLYCAVSSRNLFSTKFKMAGDINVEKLPFQLKEFFSRGSNLNNPVIIQLFPNTNKFQIKLITDNPDIN